MGCGSSSATNTTGQPMKKDGPVQYKLYYFDMYGNGEPVRMCLNAGGINFEDIRLTKEEFGKMKESGFFPAGQVPVLVCNQTGTKFNQTTAICRYIGTLTGLYGQTPSDKYWADWALETRQDFWKPDNIGPFMNPQANEEACKKSAAAFANTISLLEKRLSSNDGKPFISGDKFTIGDIVMFSLIAGVALNDGIMHKSLKEANCATLMKNPLT